MFVTKHFFQKSNPGQYFDSELFFEGEITAKPLIKEKAEKNMILIIFGVILMALGIFFFLVGIDAEEFLIMSPFVLISGIVFVIVGSRKTETKTDNSSEPNAPTKKLEFYPPRWKGIELRMAYWGVYQYKLKTGGKLTEEEFHTFFEPDKLLIPFLIGIKYEEPDIEIHDVALEYSAELAKSLYEYISEHPLLVTERMQKEISLHPLEEIDDQGF